MPIRQSKRRAAVEARRLYDSAFTESERHIRHLIAHDRISQGNAKAANRRIPVIKPVFGRDRVEQLLEGDKPPDQTDIAPLALPVNFSDAAKSVMAILRERVLVTGFIASLLDRLGGSVRAFRMAVRCRAIDHPERTEDIVPTVTAATLRDIANSEDEGRRNGAHLALCLLCEPLAAWPDSTRPERAATLLGLICQAVRERAS